MSQVYVERAGYSIHAPTTRKLPENNRGENLSNGAQCFQDLVYNWRFWKSGAVGGFAQSPTHFLAAKPRLRETRPLVCEYEARPSLGSFGRHRKHAEPGNFLSEELHVYTIGAHFPLLPFVRAASSDIGCIRLSGIAISSRYATQLKQGLLQLQSHPNRLR